MENDIMISMKIYRQGNDILVTACDENLIGKKFRDGKFQIDVNERFYKGRLVDSKTLQEYLEDATIANLVGKETVKCAEKIGLVDPSSILKIKGIPHAQMTRM